MPIMLYKIEMIDALNVISYNKKRLDIFTFIFFIKTHYKNLRIDIFRIKQNENK